MTLTTKSPGRWLWAIIVGVALCVSAPPPATAEDCADNCPENSWIVPNTGIPKIDIVMGADSRRARLTGTDMAGTVTAPVGMTGCWVRFAKPFKNPPVCVGSFSSGQADLSVVGGGGATVSGRTLTV